MQHFRPKLFNQDWIDYLVTSAVSSSRFTFSTYMNKIQIRFL